MANHEAVAALPVGGNADKQLLRDMTVRRFPYVLSDASDALTLVAVDPESGAAIIDLMVNGRVYHYDATDTTTAHDGASCLVSDEGRRYKLAAGTEVVAYSVLDNTLTEPPTSPSASVGDAYIVATAATDDWSGHDDEIAIFTSRGWEFVTVAIGRLVYVESTDTYYHLDTGGSWVAGLGGQVHAANSVPLSALINVGRTAIIVENQTTDTPPGSPSVGVAYIIGPSPTGAWSGKAGQVAICEVSSTWTYYVPANGWQAYDKALNAPYRHNGTSWVSAGGQLVGATTTGLVATPSTTTGGSGNYTYSSGTAPTTSQAYREISSTITHQAKKTSARLRFHVGYSAADTVNCAVAIFRDSEVSAIAWAVAQHFDASFRVDVLLETATADANSHTYKVRLISTGGGAPAAPTRFDLGADEYA